METYVLKIVTMKYIYYTMHFHIMNHEKKTFKSLYHENCNAKFLNYENELGERYSIHFVIYCFIQSNILSH
jgi:hypothetical protein